MGRRGSGNNYTVHMYSSKENTLARLRQAKRQAKCYTPHPPWLWLPAKASEHTCRRRQRYKESRLSPGGGRSCRLRGKNTVEFPLRPEEVMDILHQYHTAMGELIFRFEGTLERFAGDGLMVFFNDPLPCPDPAARAVRMAVDMRQRMRELTEMWRKSMHQLDFGVGITQGYATVGMIGFESRVDYAGIGSVTNLAARLCAEARGGQILISQRVFVGWRRWYTLSPWGNSRSKDSVNLCRCSTW
jgi:Adenylate and Guanylate cyclase catalytic domain